MNGEPNPNILAAVNDVKLIENTVAYSAAWVHFMDALVDG